MGKRKEEKEETLAQIKERVSYEAVESLGLLLQLRKLLRILRLSQPFTQFLPPPLDERFCPRTHGMSFSTSHGLWV